MSTKLPKVCISYSSKDAEYRSEIVKVLNSLENAGIISSWTDQKLMPGQGWNDEIQTHFKTSDIFIFLLSLDFFNSSYINDIEKEIALKNEANGAVIIPIFVRECDYQSHEWLSSRQGIPKNKWVSDFKTQDEKDEINALISKSISKSISDFLEKKRTENRIYFGFSNNAKLLRERKRVNYSLRRFEENHESILFQLSPTSDEDDELMDLDEPEFKDQIAQELEKTKVLIMLLDDNDECCQWQFDILQRHASETGLDRLYKVFLFYNQAEEDSEFNENVAKFAEQHKEKVLHQLCDNSADMTRIVSDELEEYFEERQKAEEQTQTAGDTKYVTLFFDPEDARHLFRWGIKQRLDKEDDIEVITRPDARKISVTKEMLAQSSGVALYYGHANHNWFDTIQVYLRKFFVNQKHIEPRIVFIDEPDVDVKDQMFINRDLLNNKTHKEVSILSDQNQAVEDLESFIQRVKSSNNG